MNNDLMFSSKKQDWQTPPEIFDPLNQEFNFTLDPCSNGNNAKCKNYFTEIDNGLIQDWSNQVCFINPPYTNLKVWIEKSYLEALNNNALCVLLIPARTDTIAFHKYIYGIAKEVRFIKGRIKFLIDGKPAPSPAPFPTMIVVFDFTYSLRLKNEP